MISLYHESHKTYELNGVTELVKPELRPMIGFKGYGVSSDGKIWSYKRKRWLKLSHNGKGYIKVQMWYRSRNHNKRVHRLVAENFIANPENKPYVNHINNIRDDNRVENLEWLTIKENIAHKYKNNETPNKYLKQADY